MRLRPLSPEDVEAVEALEGEAVMEVVVVSWSILVPEMKSSSIWSMHCRRWSCIREREQLGVIWEITKVHLSPMDKTRKPCVRPICFISLLEDFFRLTANLVEEALFYYAILQINADLFSSEQFYAISALFQEYLSFCNWTISDKIHPPNDLSE